MDRISRARNRMLYALPFFGALICHADIIITNDPEGSAYVVPSGLIYINKAYLDTLSDGELVFVLCHEVMHLALLYWSRQGTRKVLVVNSNGKVGALWNLAHDYAINLILHEMLEKYAWVSMPKGILLDHKYAGMSAESIYDALLQDMPVCYFGDALGECCSEDEAKWKQNLYDAVQTHMERGKGNLPNAIQLLVDDMTPKVQWQVLLARWASERCSSLDYTYMRPSRRARATNVVLPTTLRNGPVVTVLWDTSGSMAEYHNMVFRELSGILDALHAPIRVILCDSEVVGVFDGLREASELAENLVGGGGSDFCPAFELVTDRRSIIISFTDGFINVPRQEPSQPVLWVLTPDGSDPTAGAWGTVIRLPQAPEKNREHPLRKS